MPELILVTRREWGARQSTEDFIRRRVRDSKTSKTEAHIHHTTDVDSDSTRNTWTLAEAIRQLRRLEWVRPDLGPLPYSMNLAFAEDRPNTVYLFEGRGLTVRGAHTKGHNSQGIGLGWLGNFDSHLPRDLQDLGVWAMSTYLVKLRHQFGYSRLGDVRNPRGWEVWGHRDTANKSCPGGLIYPRLAEVRFLEGAPMAIPDKYHQTLIDIAYAVQQAGSHGGYVMSELIKDTKKDLITRDELLVQVRELERSLAELRSALTAHEDTPHGDSGGGLAPGSNVRIEGVIDVQ